MALSGIWTPARVEALRNGVAAGKDNAALIAAIGAVDTHLPAPTINGLRQKLTQLKLRPRTSKADETICVAGEMISIWKAAEMSGLDRKTIRRRLALGHTPEDAVKRGVLRTPGKGHNSRRLPCDGPSIVAAIRSSDEREARAMMRFGRRDVEIAEWFGWDLSRVAALRNQEATP